jgi:hypothetical protein
MKLPTLKSWLPVPAQAGNSRGIEDLDLLLRLITGVPSAFALALSPFFGDKMRSFSASRRMHNTTRSRCGNSKSMLNLLNRFTQKSRGKITWASL